MVCYFMKTIIELAVAFLDKVQRLAKKGMPSFRELTEAGLRPVLSSKHIKQPKELPPLVTFGGGGPTDEFKDWNWDKIRDQIYEGRGA